MLGCPARVAVIACLALLVLVAPAHADPTGTIVRGDGDTLVVRLTNDAGGDDALRLELGGGVTPIGPVTLAGTGGSCTAQGPAVRCGFAPTWPGSGTITLRFGTSPRQPDGAGGLLFTCPTPCGGTDLGPFSIPGPVTAQAADLAVAAQPPDPAFLFLLEHDAKFAWGDPVTFEVSNRGFAPARDVVLEVRFGDAPAGSRIQAEWDDGSGGLRSATSCPAVPGASPPRLRCRLGTVAPSTKPSRFVFTVAKGNRAGTVRVKAFGTTSTPEVGDGPNNAEYVRTSPPPDSGRNGNRRAERRIPAGKAPVLTGTASYAVRVEIAIATAQAGGCRWITSTRVTFRRERSRRCRRPTWLTAVGTSPWRLAFRRPLPRGRYTLFTRAIGVTGTTETRFTVADGNRLTLVVR